VSSPWFLFGKRRRNGGGRNAIWPTAPQHGAPLTESPPRSAARDKSLLVLFFRKEQNLLFLKKKKQKDFYS
jgi:hypothetical protein